MIYVNDPNARAFHSSMDQQSAPSATLSPERRDGASSVGRRQQPSGAMKMNGYAAKPLTLQKVNQAYALVRAADPRVTAEKWRDTAAVFLSADDAGAETTRGVVTVQNDQGYILGLFCYTACDHLRHGRTLKVENLIALDLFDSLGAIEVLLRSMTDLAQKSACTMIEAEAPAQWAGDSAVGRRLSAWFSTPCDSDSEPRLLRLLGAAPCRPLSPAAT